MVLKELTIHDCGEPITLEQLKEEEYKMLQALAEYCDSYGLRYYLSGGTLLGAMRHKGFIPWDDDIDTNMPRPDVEKLMELCKGKIGKYVLAEPDPNHPYLSESYRLYNYDYIIESDLGHSSKKKYYTPVFVDIFPIEGLPDTVEKTKKQYRKIVMLRKLINCTVGNPWHGGSIGAKLFHFTCRPFAKAIGYKRMYRKIQEIVKEYNFDECEYAGVMTAPVHTLEERIVKKEYIPIIKVQFEDGMFNAPAGYDAYLTQLYGKNYMEMPPADKQKSHHSFRLFKAK